MVLENSHVELLTCVKTLFVHLTSLQVLCQRVLGCLAILALGLAAVPQLRIPDGLRVRRTERGEMEEGVDSESGPMSG